MAEFSDFNITNEKIPLVAVVGPTASGKTDFAIEIAKKFNGEIVSMDSMQVYKYLDIGTAKPTREEMQGIPHHMLDCIDPRVSFTASDYANQAAKAVENIYSRGKLPVLCGGTGLYLNSLLYSYNMSEASFDNDLREKLYKDAEILGVDALYEKLKAIDPKSANATHPNNVKRVVRALEIYMLTGKTKSEQVTSSAESIYDTVIFGMDWQRDILYDRINRRVDIMLENGLENEVRNLIGNGIFGNSDKISQAEQAIGYKEMIAYIDGELSYDDAVEMIKMNSRRLAKRQITWFKRTNGIKWLNPCDESARNESFDIIKNFTEGHGRKNEY